MTPAIEVPKSCCLIDTSNCDTSRDNELKDKGCGDAVAEKIVFLYKTVGAISTILYILEVSPMIYLIFFLEIRIPVGFYEDIIFYALLIIVPPI